jgi:hypothetical protein
MRRLRKIIYQGTLFNDNKSIIDTTLPSVKLTRVYRSLCRVRRITYAFGLSLDLISKREKRESLRKFEKVGESERKWEKVGESERK